MGRRVIALMWLLAGVCTTRAELGDVRGSATPQVRTAYISLGKVAEDRPMQITPAQANVDLDILGKLGISFFGVSSLGNRKEDVHHRFLYFYDIGPCWWYDLKLAEGWKLKSALSRQWSLFSGYREPYKASVHTIHWYQLDQELENPYLTPFWRFRKVFAPMDLFYVKLGVRHRFLFLEDFYVTPQVQLEGGDGTNLERRLGPRTGGTNYHSTFGMLTGRLELGWRASEHCTVFAAVEQYGVVLKSGRSAVRAKNDPCARTDLTVGTVGLRLSF